MPTLFPVCLMRLERIKYDEILWLHYKIFPVYKYGTAPLQDIQNFHFTVNMHLIFRIIRFKIYFFSVFHLFTPFL